MFAATHNVLFLAVSKLQVSVIQYKNMKIIFLCVLELHRRIIFFASCRVDEINFPIVKKLPDFDSLSIDISPLSSPSHPPPFAFWQKSVSHIDRYW